MKRTTLIIGFLAVFYMFAGIGWSGGYYGYGHGKGYSKSRGDYSYKNNPRCYRYDKGGRKSYRNKDFRHGKPYRPRAYYYRGKDKKGHYYKKKYRRDHYYRHGYDSHQVPGR